MAYKFEYRIHPSVGVARMGNSETTYFLTAEKPLQPFNPVQKIIPAAPPLLDIDEKGTTGSVRDITGKLCKQGARFRVFCYAYEKSAGKPSSMFVWECKATEYDIEWEVKVANHKASNDTGMGSPIGLRKENNPDTIVLSSKVITDRNAKPFTGKPLGRLQLGSCFMDKHGRLIVLGSNGKHQNFPGSSNPPPRILPPENDETLFWSGWEDDAADGPISVKVTPKVGSKKADEINNAQTSDAVGAWVVISMPDYGADVRATTTLYDIGINHAYDRSTPKNRPDRKYLKTYFQQIIPLLHAQYAVGYTLRSHRGHIPAYSPFNLPASPSSTINVWMRLAKKTADIKPENIWKMYSHSELQSLPSPTPVGRYQPSISATKSMPNLDFTSITEIQRDALNDWESGTYEFGNSWLEKFNFEYLIPYQLDRAHMESMSGGSFYPGIEVSRMAHWPNTWEGRKGCCNAHFDVRITNKVNAETGKLIPVLPVPPKVVHEKAAAGYLTQDLANPWHADFIACSLQYWPHSRPIEVLENAATSTFVDWMRTDAGGTLKSHTVANIGSNITKHGLVDNWQNLGFIRYDPVSKKLIETERKPILIP